MANEDLLLKIGADVKGARKDLARFTKSVKTQASASERAFKGLKVAAGAAVAIFAGGKLVGALRSAVDAASKQEDAVNALNAALHRSGQFTQEASGDFQKFASSLQETTRFGDEVILKNAALIQSLGNLSNKELKGATEAATNLSAALGIDLKAAATLVGKAAAGNISSFSRYGLTIQSGATKAETFANTLKAINEQMGGAAQQDVKTYSGAMDQLDNTVGDLVEEFGFIITENPAMVGAISVLKEAFSGVGEIVKDNREELSSFVALITESSVRAVPLAVRSIGFVTSQFVSLAIGINEAAAGFKLLYLEIIQNQNSISQALELIAQPINAIVLGMAAIEKSRAEAKLKDLERQAGRFQRIVNGTQSAWNRLWSPETVSEAQMELNKVTDEISKINDEIKLLEGTGQEIAKEIDKAAGQTAAAFSKSVADAITRNEKLEKLKVDLEVKSTALEEKLQGLTDQISKSAGGAGSGSSFGPSSGSGGSSPSSAPSDEAAKIFEKFQKDQEKAEAAATQATKSSLTQIATFVDAIGKGAEGAEQAVIQASTLIADSMLPGLGSIVDPLLNFAKDPEAFTASLTEFTEALPEVIRSLLADGLPKILIAVAENSDKMLIAIAEALPDVLEALIRNGPKIGLALLRAIPRAIAGLLPVIGDLVDVVIKLLEEGAKEVGTFLGGALQKPIEDLVAKINGPVDKFRTAVGNIGQNFNNAALGVARAIDNAFGNVFSQIGAVFGNLFTNLGSVFETIFGTIGTTLVSSLEDGATDFVDTLIGGIESFFSDGLGQFFEGFSESFRELFAKLDPTKNSGKAVEDIKDFIKDPIGTITGRSFGLTGGRSFGGGSVTPIGDARSGESEDTVLLRAILAELKSGNSGTPFAYDKFAKMLKGANDQRVRTA